ncbi:nucleotidyltransferase domain-containing protein [Pedobacter alpinus]|uniref:Nucleotidyltransferase domain-containing protein n=1 Tax=Pedobacter alpinus TaxID=1590643 RepID=A0ABW5TRH1_9SPHI
MKNTGLDVSDINRIKDVFFHYPEVEKVILYGSRAKGNYKPASDIDLTLIGDGIDLTLLQSIEFELDDLLLPYKFDVSIYKKISNNKLLEHIDRIGLDFFSR